MCNCHRVRCVSIVAILALALGIEFTNGFVAPLALFGTRSQQHASSSSMVVVTKGMFGNFQDAFKNDDTLGKAENPGLKKGPNFNDNTYVNGKKVPGAVVGQKLTVVAGKVRVKIPVSCQKGDCATCEVKLNGRMVRACQTPLPSGQCIIETF